MEMTINELLDTITEHRFQKLIELIQSNEWLKEAFEHGMQYIINKERRNIIIKTLNLNPLNVNSLIRELVVPSKYDMVITMWKRVDPLEQITQIK